MKRILTATAAVALLMMAFAPNAKAQYGGEASAATNLHVTATVVTTCIMSSTPIDFGATDSVTLASNTYHATGQLLLQCANGVTPANNVFTFDGGRNGAGVGSVTTSGSIAYAMSNGTAYLGYEICPDPACLSSITPGSTLAGPSPSSFTSAETPVVFDVYGVMPPQTQTIGPGIYNDSIYVTFD